MSNFKTWLESFDREKEQKIRQVWSDALKSLVGAIDDEDAVATPLVRIVHKGQGTNSMNTFKGKVAAGKKLASADIFNQLKQLDPQLAQGVEEAERWLGQNDPKHANNADTTVGSLLEKLFGPYFHKLLDSDAQTGGEAKLQKAPAAAPQDDTTMPTAQPVQQPSPQMQPQQMQPMGLAAWNLPSGGFDVRD